MERKKQKNKGCFFIMQGDDALKIPQIPTPTKLRVFEFLDTQKYLLSSTSLATLQKNALV